MGSIDTSCWGESSPRFIESIQAAIAEADDQLRALSVDIHAHPELAWEEHHAHDALTCFMEQQGFIVERHAFGMATAWKATFEIGQGGGTIGFNSEMDALKGIGHACGHNLIAMAGCAAALGVASALKKHAIAGRVVLLGTPAEEAGGGKSDLVALGAYQEMDACLMVHPAGPGTGSASTRSNCIAAFTVTYAGKSAHAAGAPETAINALDAAVAAYLNVSLLRQQISSTNRIHGTISGSEGWSGNVLPSHSKVLYGIRAPTGQELIALVPRVLNCFKAAALSTGCSVEITKEILYLDLQPCKTLAGYYKEFCEATWGDEGYEVPEATPIGGSTDFGDVTYRLPGLHPMFMLPDAKEGEFPHSDSYTAAAITLPAHRAAIQAATAIAVVGARVILDNAFRKEARSSWQEQMASIKAQKTIDDLAKLMSEYPAYREPRGINSGEAVPSACLSCGH